MAPIIGTKSPNSSYSENTSSEGLNIVGNLQSGNIVSSDAQFISEPRLILTQREAAILLGWRAACYASGSSAVNRVGNPGSVSEDMTFELKDRSEWELERRLLEFEGGQFVLMGRRYWPDEVRETDDGTLDTSDRQAET